MITVVPFVWHPGETDDEQTKVVILADVDGHRGRFIVDLGCPQLYLNRTFLHPAPDGGIDTVTAANRIPERPGHKEDTVHISSLRIGTLIMKVEDPTLPKSVRRSPNAVLNHAFGDYYNFAPRLGNIGLSVLEPFETIIDYPRRRLILIRLDRTGHRLVPVPAYKPVWAAPLVDWPFPPAAGQRFAGEHLWGVQSVFHGETDTLIFDTGAGVNVVSPRVWAHTINGVIPDLLIAGRVFQTVPTSEMTARFALNILGYPFLRDRGIVGFNHRTHQFLLYQ